MIGIMLPLAFGIITALLGMAVIARVYIIDLRRPVENAGRKFGAAGAYYRATVRDESGHARRALFTADQVHVALLRAECNPEDVQ